LGGDPAYDDDPAWSPDGQKIAFVRFADRNFEVYVVNADGSGLRNLTRNAAWDSWPVWSPDGRRIAFLRGGSYRQPNSEIYVMNADGSGQRRLTRNPALPPPRDWPAGPEPWRARAVWHDGDPVWSPDAKKIAFVSGRDGGIPEFYVMNADGSGQRNLTRNPAEDFAPAWSPDGRKIAFVSDREGNGEIYVMNANGTGQRNLTRNPARIDGNGRGIAWSPGQKN
jgi:TolB protein